MLFLETNLKKMLCDLKKNWPKSQLFSLVPKWEGREEGEVSGLWAMFFESHGIVFIK